MRQYISILLSFLFLIHCIAVVDAAWPKTRKRENKNTTTTTTTNGEQNHDTTTAIQDDQQQVAPSKADGVDSSTNSNSWTTSSSSSSSSFWNATTYLHSKLEEHSTQMKQDWNDISEDVYNEVQYHRNQFYNDWNAVQISIANTVKKSQQEFKNRILQDVFSQRIGWERLRHSIRDHVGGVIGLWITFRGQVNPRLKGIPPAPCHRRRPPTKGSGGGGNDANINDGVATPAVATVAGGGSIALQLAQMIWHILETHTPLFHSPWAHDLLSIILATSIWKHGLPNAPQIIRQCIPYLLFPTVLLPLWSVVLEEWTIEQNDKAPFAFVLISILSTYAGLHVLHIPIPLAASSLSGAVLVYDSVRAEIAGNYIHMVQLATKTILPAGRFVLRLLWRPAVWIWRKGLNHIVLEIFWPDRVRAFWIRGLRNLLKVWRFVTHPIHTCLQALSNHQWIQQIDDWIVSLRRSIRPILVPLFLTIWGIAVQMDYIQGIGGIWRIFRLSLDPIAFVRGRIKGFFSPESRARKFVLQTLRRIPRYIKTILIAMIPLSSSSSSAESNNNNDNKPAGQGQGRRQRRRQQQQQGRPPPDASSGRFTNPFSRQSKK